MNNLDYPLPVLELVAALKQLPGIGTRGAERMALWMLQGHMGEAESIARTIGQAADSVTPCPGLRLFQHGGSPLRSLPGRGKGRPDHLRGGTGHGRHPH